MNYFTLTILLLSAIFTQAGQSDLFEINEKAIYAEFADLTAAENIIIAASLLSEQNKKQVYLKIQSSLTPPPDDYYGNNPVFGIPSFIWGCCLGPMGIIITQIMTEDVSETKKAAVGCAVSACVVGGCYFLGALQSFAR